MNTQPSLLILAGGTGGHIFPALAVAQALKELNWKVYWLGSVGGMENEIVAQHHPWIEFFALRVTGLRRHGWLHWITGFFSLWRQVFQAWKMIRVVRPTVVLGMGGYVSGPGGLAAWLARRPLLLHEQNSVPGLTNRYLSRLASCVMQAFPKTFAENIHAVTTGNPIRKSLCAMEPPRHRLLQHQGPIRLLVLGGSRGAQSMNQAVPKALSLLSHDKRPLVWHQTGQALLAETQTHYAQAQYAEHIYRIEPFIEQMEEAYAWADIVCCRAGALTLSELTAVGLASLLAPYPYAVDNHQEHNAMVLVKAGAAIMVRPEQMLPERLAYELTRIMNDRAKLISMASHAYDLGKRDATQWVVNECLRWQKN